jgi:hypothetical protein
MAESEIYKQDMLREGVKGDYFLIIANNLGNDSEKRPYELYTYGKKSFDSYWEDLLELGTEVPLRGYKGVSFDVVNEISSDVNALVGERFSDCKRIHSFDDLISDVDMRLVDFRKVGG